SLSYEKRGTPRRYVTPAEATSTERAVNSPRKPPERRSDNGEDVPPSEGYPHRLPHGPGGGLLRRRPGGLRGWRADDRRAGPRRRVRSPAGRLRSPRRRRCPRPRGVRFRRPVTDIVHRTALERGVDERGREQGHRALPPTHPPRRAPLPTTRARQMV